MDTILSWLPGVVAALVGIAIGYAVRFAVAKRSRQAAEYKQSEELESAKSRAREVVVEARDQAASILVEAQKEEKERKQELRQLEERLLRREDALQAERSSLETRSRDIEREKGETQKERSEAQAVKDRAMKEIERVSGMGRDEARAELFKEITEDNHEELAQELVRLERERRDALESKATEIMTSALQRCARERIADVTTSIVELPNEDLKGKIIGREGRNIRTFERLTGVEVIIDEVPDGLVLSSFDPMRRELAKIALEKLIKDGRIQPAKVEEKVEEARAELDNQIHKVGEEAMYEVGIVDLPKELIMLLGRLNYRTSYGQNVLTHSIEMAHISGAIAAELGLDIAVAKKGALLHDIGKAIDHDVEGTHVSIGRKLLEKYSVDPKVIRAMEAHHDEYPFASPESYIVAAADVISAARPGARRGTLEKYLRRLEDMEKVVKSFDGVKQAYALSAGREVRVFVVPEKIDDFRALQLAKEIAGKIQSDIDYPGEVKVTVIREIKAVEYAR